MKRFPVTSFNILYTYLVGRSDLSHFQRNSTGPVSLSEQPDRPGFRANFSHWRPIGRYLKPNPIRAVLKPCKTRPTYVQAGLTTPRTDQMFGPMPILVSGHKCCIGMSGIVIVGMVCDADG